jgi:hypothetical protein
MRLCQKRTSTRHNAHIAGHLSDQSAAEVAARLREAGIDIDQDAAAIAIAALPGASWQRGRTHYLFVIS